MTTQEIYNHVARHLLTQGRKALAHVEETGKDLSCVYRAPNGDRCAAGCLILPEHYDPIFEGHSVAAPSSVPDFSELSSRQTVEQLNRALFYSGVDMSDREVYQLVRTLQTLHDMHEPETWPVGLAITAQEKGLVPFTLDSLTPPAII